MHEEMRQPTVRPVAPIEEPEELLVEPRARPLEHRQLGEVGETVYFLAEQQADGTYRVALTEDGIETFETALGIAGDLGGKTRISTQSSIADIMERTAVREELARLLRHGGNDAVHRLRVHVLRRMLWGSEEPGPRERLIGHLGKILIVGALALWTLAQFVIAVQDIAAIPGILANLPNDLIQLHPGSAFSDVGARISDAGHRVLVGVFAFLLTYLVAKVMRPFDPIYRKDQLLPGERPVLRRVREWLRRAAVRRAVRRTRGARTGSPAP